MTTGPHDDDSDRDRPEEARGSRDGDELDAAEVDERFAALIADFGDDTPHWPDDEDTDPDTPEASGESGTTLARVSEPDEEPSLLELWDTDLPQDEDDEEEEEYEPPPPPPLPVPSLPAVLGVVMVLGGVTLIVWPQALGVGSQLGLATGVMGFVGGVLTLIWRLRPEPDDGESDNDNGAVV